MKCMVCGMGPQQGVTLLRQNEKGVTGIWACQQHSRAKDDPELQRLIAAIEAAERTKQ